MGNATRKTVLGLLVLAMFAIIAVSCGTGTGTTPTPTPTSSGGGPTPTPSEATPTAPEQTPSPSESVSFAGKTVRIIVGFTAGGGYDAYARLLAKYLPQYLPGNPTVIVENMPGASGLQAANYMALAAPRDGTVLATTTASAYLSQFLGEEGVQFDVLDLNPLGSLASANQITYIRTDYLGDITTLEELAAAIQAGEKEPPFFATTGVSSTTTHQWYILEELIPGLRGEIVAGYPGNSEVRLAFRQGEADAAGGSQDSFEADVGDLWEAGALRVVSQTGTADGSRDPEFPDAPTLGERVQTPFHRSLVSTYVGSTLAYRWYFYPPGVDEATLRTMLQAFEAAAQDPNLQAEAQAAGRPVSLVRAETIRQTYEDVFTTSPEDAERIKAILTGER